MKAQDHEDSSLMFFKANVSFFLMAHLFLSLAYILGQSLFLAECFREQFFLDI